MQKDFNSIFLVKNWEVEFKSKKTYFFTIEQTSKKVNNQLF